MKIIITESQYRQIIKESGIRDIKKIAERYPKAKIYFHQDLDGVTTAIAMKNYLEQNGIKVVDAEVIQYGDKEFSVKKLDAEGDVMPVLVDFAHGKPMFVIHTDHHDTQAGVESGTATSFKASRSNVETISQTISPKDIFPSDDLLLISTVDSANFLAHDITFDMVMNYIFKMDKDQSLQRNKMMMGLVTNKLLLAFKNKPKFLETLVMKSNPSLLSILNNIRDIMKVEGYAEPEELEQNKQNYIEKMKEFPKVQGKVIVQYGGGSMTKPGSYDRYTPFKNNPDADFLVIAWPTGIVQASCNAYKGERSLKGVNLGEMKDEVLEKFEPELSKLKISFGTLKRVSESKAGEGSVGFTLKDFLAIYGNAPSLKIEGNKEDTLSEINKLSDKLYSTLTFEEKMNLEKASVNGMDVVKANSGGHKCITNISGLSYLYTNIRRYKDDELKMIQKYGGSNNFVLDIQRKLKSMKKNQELTEKQKTAAVNQIKKEIESGRYNPDIDNKVTSYVDMIKKIQQEFVKVLESYIEKESINENVVEKKKYYIDDSEIKGAGKGVFAKTNIKKGERIGLLHTIKKMGVNYDFTELGKMHNHSGKPTCHNEKVGNKRYLVASKDLKKGEELTTNYRLQPDLEQPKEGWGNLKEEKEFKPHIDGYRTYSPFKDLPYIIVKGNGIDCDNIVHDLVLVGDNKKVKYCKKNTGVYKITGASKIVELPVDKTEDVEEIFKSPENVELWVKEKIKSVDKKGEIRRMMN